MSLSILVRTLSLTGEMKQEDALRQKFDTVDKTCWEIYAVTISAELDCKQSCITFQRCFF